MLSQDTVDRVYRVRHSYRTAISVLAPVMCGVCVWLCARWWFASAAGSDARTLMFCSAALAGVLLCLVSLADTYLSYFQITDEEIILKDALRTRRMRIADIAGIRYDGESTVWVYANAGKVTWFRVRNHFEKWPEITQWFVTRFPDREAQAAQRQVADALSDARFGHDLAARRATLARAQAFAKYLNAAAVLLLLWTVFYPKPYAVAIALCAVWPLLAFAAVIASGGLIRLEQLARGGLPQVGIAILLTAAALVVRAIADWNLVERSAITIPFVLWSVAIASLVLVTENDFSKKRAIWFLAALLSLPYAYGAVVTLNCAFDSSKPVAFSPRVLDKNFAGGKQPRYFLALTPWGPHPSGHEVPVSRAQFDSARQGKAISVRVRNGALGIPWYEVDVVRQK